MTTCSVRRWGASTAETTSRPDRDRRRASRTVAKSPPMGSIVSRASRGGFGAPESRGLGRSDLPNRLRRITDTQWVASSLCSLEIEGAATDRPSRDFPGSKGSRRLRPDQRPRRRWRDRRGKMLDSGPISDGHREPVLALTIPRRFRRRRSGPGLPPHRSAPGGSPPRCTGRSCRGWMLKGQEGAAHQKPKLL